MEALRSLFIVLGLDADETAFANAQAAVDALEKAGELLVDAFKEVSKQLIETVVQTAEYADRIDDAAKRTGATTDSLQELGYAASQSGSSFETVETALTKLSEKMKQASEGNTEAMKTFGELGVRVTDANGELRSTTDVFYDVVGAIEGTENPTKKSAIALEVFSKAGKELLPVLVEGRAGLQALTTQAHDLGLVMGEDAVHMAADFNDMLSASSAVLRGFRGEVGAVLIEGLTPMLRGVLDWVAANRELIGSRLQQFAHGVLVIFKGLAAVGLLLGKVVMALVDHWRLLAAVLGSYVIAEFVILNGALLEQLVAWALNTVAALAYGTASIGAAVSSAAAWVAAQAPLVLLVALLSVLALGAEDVWVALHGGDSLIGSLGPKWTKFLDEWLADDTDDGWLMTALKAVIWMITDITERLPESLGTWKGMIGDFFKSLPGASFFADTTIGGGAASPEASAAAAPGRGGILAPNMASSFIINAAPGQSPQEIANAVRDSHDAWFQEVLGPVPYAIQGG